MAQMKLVYTTSKKIDSLDIVDGQIIFCPDDDIIALDMKSQRFTYKTIKTFDTDADRLNAAFAAPGFYYVEETNIIWRLTAAKVWRRITPTNISPVIYGETKEVFPTLGEEGILYYTDNGIYNWKPQLNTYNLIANANTWEGI